MDSPWNDLQLYKFLLEYVTVDKLIAQLAIQALNCHLLVSDSDN